MISIEKKQEYYKALLAKDSEYEGIFYVGVKTTEIFCRPTCLARKPKFENCEFYLTVQEALDANFRPCKRCRPLLYPKHGSELIQKLITAIELEPERRWSDQDFQNLSIDASTARRQFKKRFGMSFIEYVRAHRMGLGAQQIRAGEAVIEAQLSSGYESSSGFRDAFTRVMGAAPSLSKDISVFKAAWLDTMLGPMLAVADEEALYLLEFVDRKNLEDEVKRSKDQIKRPIIPGKTAPIFSIEKEIEAYFKSELKEFKTPLCMLGSLFQKQVWHELQKIPYGTTRSYADIAASIGKPSAYRAVANANGANKFAIVIPCHRVINTNGNLSGYAGGIARKNWLIQHEKRNVQDDNSN